MEFFKLKGKVYHLLGMYGGVAYLGKPLDVNNGVVWSGVIWENQPFSYDHEINPYVKTFFYVLRYFKRDQFGNSQFSKDLGL